MNAQGLASIGSSFSERSWESLDEEPKTGPVKPSLVTDTWQPSWAYFSFLSIQAIGDFQALNGEGKERKV